VRERVRVRVGGKKQKEQKKQAAGVRIGGSQWSGKRNSRRKEEAGGWRRDGVGWWRRWF
jgi:hypothetical protein